MHLDPWLGRGMTGLAPTMQPHEPVLLADRRKTKANMVAISKTAIKPSTSNSASKVQVIKT